MVGNTGVFVDRRCRVAVVVIYNFLWDCLIKNYGVVCGGSMCPLRGPRPPSAAIYGGI